MNEFLAALDWRPALVCEARHCNHLATHMVRQSCGHDGAVLCGVDSALLVNNELLNRVLGGVSVCFDCKERVHLEVVPISAGVAR